MGILRKAEIDIAYLGEDEWCCGMHLLWAGFVDLAKEPARHNIDAVKASGAKKIVL